MADDVGILDLSDEPPDQVRAAAFHAVKDLRRGKKIVLITAQEPVLLMNSLDLQLRHDLSWNIVEADGRWRIEVVRRADAAPLERD